MLVIRRRKLGQTINCGEMVLVLKVVLVMLLLLHVNILPCTGDRASFRVAHIVNEVAANPIYHAARN